MNKLRPILLILTAVAALSVAHPAKANLITNGGFETGDFTGWTLAGGRPTDVHGTVLGVPPHSGNFQMVSVQSPQTSGQLSQSVSTTPGASYTITFFLALLGDNSGNTSMSVMWGGVTLLSLTHPGDFGYTEYTFTETASTASTELLFGYTGEIGIWLLDDVSVNPSGVGVPDSGSTLSLLGFASLGLVALRRKLGC